MNTDRFLLPTWPAPKNVKAFSTTRLGGESVSPYRGFNLGQHVGDDPEVVDAHRTALVSVAELPQSPVWLNQTHSTDVQVISSQTQGVLDGDASYSQDPNAVCCVMTADCLPVLFCDEAGTQVAATHAGWRGLVDGILENTVAKFSDPSLVMAWLAPAIGSQCFEVGDDVRDAFLAHDIKATVAFTPKGDKWLADLYLLARQRLKAVGVTKIFGGEYCTYSDPERFYSYRRDGVTGRQASLIWLDKSV